MPLFHATPHLFHGSFRIVCAIVCVRMCTLLCMNVSVTTIDFPSFNWIQSDVHFATLKRKKKRWEKTQPATTLTTINTIASTWDFFLSSSPLSSFLFFSLFLCIHKHIHIQTFKCTQTLSLFFYWQNIHLYAKFSSFFICSLFNTIQIRCFFLILHLHCLFSNHSENTQFKKTGEKWRAQTHTHTSKETERHMWWG